MNKGNNNKKNGDYEPISDENCYMNYNLIQN